MHIDDLYKIYITNPHITTDTRKIEPGSIFFALKGDKFNGNAFAERAIVAGAAYAVIDEPAFQKDERYLLVDNVLETLQQLAREHRKRLEIPVIGVTGTNGKTTTKELIKAVLERKYRTFATEGNLNNHIGVPLSILSIGRNTEMAVIEMGANHVGEIEFLCGIARPGYGLISNVGRAHLEGFGSFEGVKQAKGELYRWLAASGGTVFLQQGNEHLQEMAAPLQFRERISYGLEKGVDYEGRLLANDPYLGLEWLQGGQVHQVTTHLTGAYNAENLLAAIAVGSYFGVEPEDINAGLGDYLPSNNRSQIVESDRNTLICDYYNANATSMKAALDNMEAIESHRRKMVILGDMFEMGDEAETEHAKVILRAKELVDAECIFIGEEFYKHKEPWALFFRNTEEARLALETKRLEGRLILLKASRGMAFENLVPVL
jgi:UDP-N-acetylmuramoyl-tripeptide--D-alanyl-D-alanine ligase